MVTVKTGTYSRYYTKNGPFVDTAMKHFLTAVSCKVSQ